MTILAVPMALLYELGIILIGRGQEAGRRLSGTLVDRTRRHGGRGRPEADWDTSPTGERG